MQAHWTEIDAQILKRIAWAITNATIVAVGRQAGGLLDLPILVKHWPHELFEPSQTWAANLNI